VSYEDHFRIRRWRTEEILAALARAGFRAEADVSARFSDLGADYLLMRKES